MLPTQSDWTGRGVFATRPALRETNPTNSTPPARVRGRSGEAGEGKPLPFLGTQELTEAAPPKPPPLPEVGTPSAEPPHRRAEPGSTLLSRLGDDLAGAVDDRPPFRGRARERSADGDRGSTRPWEGLTGVALSGRWRVRGSDDVRRSTMGHRRGRRSPPATLQRVRRVSRWRDPPRSAADGPAASPRAGTLSGEAGRGRFRPRPPRPWDHDRACRLDSNRNWDIGIFSVQSSDTYQTTQFGHTRRQTHGKHKMDRHVATSHDEVLGAGLAKLTSLCTVSGTPKANADGVALVGVVIASLFAPPPGVATHSVEADGGLADFPNPKGPGGSMDPSRARPVAEAVVVEPEGEASDGASDGGAGEDREYMSDDGAAEAAAAGAAPVPGAVLVDAEMSDAPTLLGSILGDETASLALAEAWGVYPPDLRGPFANDLYGRLADNFDGAEDPLEAAMAFLCVLTRDVGVAFDATDFWAAAKRFVREERKRAADKLPVWLPALLTHLAAAVREFAGRAPKQSEAVTRKIVNAALPAWAKVRRSEVADVEVAIRPAYPTGASVKVRAVLVAATWALWTLQKVARSVVERPGEGLAAPSVTAFPGVAAEFGVSANTLARCLGMVPVGADGVAPTVAAAPDPTKDHLLAPDPAFRGWAHPSRDEHTRRGEAWKGANLVVRQIAAATYAYPFSNKEGTTSETCLVLAHGEKAQGDGTLCHGCMARAGCTERYAYTRGGFALKQGHVAACQTQVLAQLKCTFPGGVFDPKLCVGLKEGVHAIPCSLTPNGAEGGGVRIKDPAEWAAAMRAARRPYESHTSAGPRAQPYAVDRAVAHNRAIPVCADDFDWPGVSLPIHPQDDHESWFYYRWEAGGPANVPIQALKVTADMAMHESWTPSWYATDGGKAYLALSRDEKRAELLKAMASRPATRAGKKRRTAKKRVPSESDADSADDPFSGAGYQMKVAKVEVEHITLVADGTTLSGRIAERLGAPGYAQVHGLDRSRALPVLLQEGMSERPLLVWTFPYAEYALSSFHRLVRGRVLPQTPFDGLDLTLGVASATLGGYVVRGDSVVGALLEWLAPYVGSKVGTDLADLTLFIRSYSERSDHRVAGRMYPTQVAPRQCWHITPQPAGLGGELPAGLLAAVEARVRELDVTAGSREEWAAYLHRRMQVMFAMPPERWAYTLLHLAEYNGGRLPGLVDPGLSTREAGTSAPHDHEYGVVQEVLLHAMYWVMSRARIEVPVEEGGEMWEPPEDERTGPAAPLRRTALGGSRLRDLTELAAFLAAFRSPPRRGRRREPRTAERPPRRPAWRRRRRNRARKAERPTICSAWPRCPRLLRWRGPISLGRGR